MAGFSSITGQESIMNADNASFDGTERSGAMTTNGELWIGSTALPHVKKGTITSPDGSITAGYSSPNLTLQVSGGTTTGKTITGNTGGALSPTAGNWNIPGTNSALNGYSPWTSGSGSTLTVNMPGTVKWVVNPTTNLGTHTTIQSAITAASSGDDIFITPGTYTENLTLKAGVNLVAYMGDATTPNVTISGNATATFAGTCSISNIRLQTNSAAFLTVSGSSATIVNVNSCYLNCTNNTGLSFSSSSSSATINISNCFGNIGTTGISLFSHSSAGALNYIYSTLSNTGNSTTASTVSAGSLITEFSYLTVPVTLSSTGACAISYTDFNLLSLNTTCFTAGGSGPQTATASKFYSGTASAISVSQTLTLIDSEVNSSNTNAITGSGTIILTSVSFSGSSSLDNVTNKTARNTHFGGISFDGGTNTLSNYATGVFTPALARTNLNITYTTQSGAYTRIGNRVFCSMQITINTVTNAGSGATSVTGLPFTVGSALDTGVAGYHTLTTLPTSTNVFCIAPVSGGTTANLIAYGTLGASSSNAIVPTAGATMFFSFQYQI